VKGDLQGIVKAKKLSHAVMKNINQNLFFAFFTMYSEYQLQQEFYILFGLYFRQ
jgi:hypothetical protein